MTINLTQEESLKIFEDALANGVRYVIPGYGLQLDFDEEEYKAAKTKLSAPCLEDVLIQILKDGGKLTMVDVEGGGTYTRSISIEDVYNRVPKTPADNLLRINEEQDDVIDADAVLQTVFFEEIIFG